MLAFHALIPSSQFPFPNSWREGKWNFPMGRVGKFEARNRGKRQFPLTSSCRTPLEHRGWRGSPGAQQGRPGSLSVGLVAGKTVQDADLQRRGHARRHWGYPHIWRCGSGSLSEWGQRSTSGFSWPCWDSRHKSRPKCSSLMIAILPSPHHERKVTVSSFTGKDWV